MFNGQSEAQGGGYIVQVADEEQGKSNGLFFFRGNLKEPSPQCADREKQKKMIQVIRDMLK